MKKIRKIKKIVNSETLIVTVDISKNKSTGYFRCPDGTEVKPFEFSTNREGFNNFYKSIEWMKCIKQLSQVVVGFESTGSYAEPLVHFLRKKEINLVQVNTSHTKKIKEIYDNSPGKTDNKDPKVLADLVELGRVLKVVVPEGVAAELRRLAHARERYISVRTSIVNQLYDLVYLIFPEFGQIIKDIQSKSAQHLLKEYPTPEEIIHLGIEDLAKILYRVSRGRFDRDKAEQLYEAANQTIGIQEGKNSIVEEIKNILKAISQQNQFINECEENMSKNLEKIPCSRYLLSMKGIGVITAAVIIGEVSDFNNFRTGSEVEKFAGLNLFEISSGKHTGIKRISKRGRPLLRKILYFASLNVVRKGGIFHEKYQSYIDRGMVKPKALIAISRKLLRVMFAIVRDHKKFDINYLETKQILKAA